MWQIAKSQLYQLKKASLVKISFFIVFLLYATLMITNVIIVPDDEPAITAGEIAASSFPTMAPLSFIFILVLINEVCCADYSDKTANYEIMLGHRRIESYFGRIIPCYAVGLAGYAFLTISVILVSSAFIGWGNKLNASDALIRWGLTFFPVIRIMAEFILIAFICRKSYVVLLAGYMIYMLEILIISELGRSSYLLGFSNINTVASVDTWISYGLHNPTYYVYDASVTSELCIYTIAVSLIFTAASLFLGYVFFRNDDLN